MRKSTYTVCIFIMFISNVVAFASYIANGFVVTEKSTDFKSSAKCSGNIPYPELANADKELAAKVNDKILDFVELYAICNKGDKSNFSVTYDVPESDSIQVFSVIWPTKKDGKLYRIDTLNFNMRNNNLLGPEGILVNNSSNFIGQMVNLSGGHLSKEDSWEQFLNKVVNRDIQFYIRKKEWHIVFNSTPELDKIVDVKIPKYFLQGRDVTSEE